MILFGVWSCYAAFGLTATSLAPLVPLIEGDLSISHTAMGSIMGAWQLTYIAFAIPGGILLDKIGSRFALSTGVLIIACSAMLRGLSEDFFSMLFAVMLFGVGGPIVSAGAPKIITRWFQGSDRGLAMGIYMTGPAVGGVVSLTLTHSVLLPLLGSWQNLMFLNASIALLVAMLWFVIASRPSMRSAEALTRSSLEKQPLLIGTLLKQPAVQLVLIMSVGVFLVNHGLNNWLPSILQTSGMTLIEAGYWAAIPTVIGILGSLTIPRFATPGRRFEILLGLSLAAAIATILLQFTNPALQTTGLILQGIARSSLMTVLILTLVELPGIGDKYAGMASGLFFSAAEVGGVMGPIALGVLYDVSGNFSFALTLLTVISVGLALATLRLKRLAQIQ
jgi:MFS transporter, CP family, cyanate transporter